MLANQIDLQLKVLAKTDQSVSRSNEKLKFETSALVTLYGDQFKLSTQLIKHLINSLRMFTLVLAGFPSLVVGGTLIFASLNEPGIDQYINKNW